MPARRQAGHARQRTGPLLRCSSPCVARADSTQLASLRMLTSDGTCAKLAAACLASPAARNSTIPASSLHVEVPPPRDILRCATVCPMHGPCDLPRWPPCPSCASLLSFGPHAAEMPRTRSRRSRRLLKARAAVLLPPARSRESVRDERACGAMASLWRSASVTVGLGQPLGSWLPVDPHHALSQTTTWHGI